MTIPDPLASCRLFVDGGPAPGREQVAALLGELERLTKPLDDCGICKLGGRTLFINDDCPTHGDEDW